jgi:asparagine synthase (glutamine-hydrolysing)
MCGICGQFNFLHGDKISIENLASMTSELVHRGPDDHGYYTDGSLGLGFRRLSIIDLQGGHQPMSNLEQSVWVVFNGEIYNFLDVRQQLENRGYQFRTNSDTEVIVHGFEEWGDNVLDRLNGMFGLAIWDVKRRRLMLARDRMGIKPIYYTIQDGRLLFGSEMRAIVAGLGERPTIDPQAVESSLRYRYTPAPETILEGINKLPAGTRLVVEEGRSPKVERWWNFSPQPFDPMPTDADATAELLHIYSKAVKRHLISDVPVGLLLSGGMDSALLLALMSKVQGSWKTYSVGYGTSFVDDELRDAAETARLLGASNIPIQISCSEFEENLDRVVTALEEPVATSSVIPMYYVCQRAREDVTVALIGQGPDELFGGYKRHLGVHYGQYWRALPKVLRSGLKSSFRAAGRRESLQRAVYSLEVEDRLTRYQQVFSLMPEKSIRMLFRGGVLTDSSEKMPGYWQDLWALMQDTDELGGLQFLEIRSSLPDELLLYADKLSMAHSLELRVPYLDQEVVEYAERLNASFKVRYGTRKRLHRLVAQQFLPKEILTRKKRGFATNVVDDWLRTSVSQSMQRIFVDGDSLVYRYLDPVPIRKLLHEHEVGKADHHKILFGIIVLEHLLRKYATHHLPTRTDIGATTRDFVKYRPITEVI